MNVNRVLDVKERDPIGTLRSFLDGWWEQSGVQALLAPVELPVRSGVMAKWIENRAELERVTPFAPVMLSNSAACIAEAVQEQPHTRVAAILRPCELRAFIELQKRRRISIDPHYLVIIGIDCLGTFPRREYFRSVETQGTESVTGEILRNAAEGGLRSQRFRTACMVCDWPAPCGADITIGVIGVPNHEHLLVIARDEEIDSRLGLESITDGLATEYQVSHRETVVGAIADMRAGVRKKMIEDMQGSNRFNDLASFLAWFAGCSLCGECLSSCPLYTGELDPFLRRAGAEKAESAPLAGLVALSRWLASCSGCGMCEDACNCNVPLTLFVSALSHRIRGEMHYRCGDPSQPLPWASR